MAYFLIDYENLSGRALEGISLVGLRKKDVVIFFYSKHAARITMELHQELKRIPAQTRFIPIESGTSNALDFQLSSYLGACIHRAPRETYYIVSMDGGYDCVCRFWNRKKIDVKRIERFHHYVHTAR